MMLMLTNDFVKEDEREYAQNDGGTRYFGHRGLRPLHRTQ